MPTAKEVQRELCRREWAERIIECESSNMSVREWCAANGLNVNTYYGRVASLKKDTAKTKKTSMQDIVPLSAVKEKPDVPIYKNYANNYTFFFKQEDLEWYINLKNDIFNYYLK